MPRAAFFRADWHDPRASDFRIVLNLMFGLLSMRRDDSPGQSVMKFNSHYHHDRDRSAAFTPLQRCNATGVGKILCHRIHVR